MSTKFEIINAVHASMHATLDKFVPNWSSLPLDQMNATERQLFDAITELEHQTRLNIARVFVAQKSSSAKTRA